MLKEGTNKLYEDPSWEDVFLRIKYLNKRYVKK